MLEKGGRDLQTFATIERRGHWKKKGLYWKKGNLPSPNKKEKEHGPRGLPFFWPKEARKVKRKKVFFRNKGGKKTSIQRLEKV